ncbi:hypothetical protein Poli38472_008448 [Pythium oligandrum]|uniref:UPF3 domain-containing protein n=1 Tax=Pythium oligandrum TaxID=41045 RepID=A0A8K1FA17_PYTOL|nr:hypothetical protein Poli38472_008448 [Pythium oligandrum]|eukprot:TMW55800.1 hypothetical protein Poli38472_008448 [Pythium oligandrum]
MRPPSSAQPRRGGGGKGRGRGRGGSGRGSAPASASVSAVAPATANGSAAAPSSSTPARNSRESRSKPNDKAKQRKRGGARGPGDAQTARPPRAAVAMMRKVLVRDIPHTMDLDKMLEVLDANGVARDSVWRFVPGKVRGNNRVPRPGRLYLDFKKETELAKTVITKLDGYVLSDVKDTPKLQVDFAPFQKIPREKARKDTKIGTIDRDPDFLAFLEELAKPNEKLPSADVVADAKESEGAEKPVAALVQYLNERKRDKAKGKYGKTTEKGKGPRAKSTKETKGGKDRTKTSKIKTKNGETKTPKEAAPKGARKPRGKAKEVATMDQVEPGMLKIMTGKGNSSGSGTDNPRPAIENTEIAGQGKGKGPGKGQRRNGPQGASREGEGDVTGESTDAAKDKTRGRRENRPAKNPKGSGAGRPEQKKKLFVPKAPMPVG